MLKTTNIIGTDCVRTDHSGLLEELVSRAGEGLVAVDFTNVHIVAMRRTQRQFREACQAMDMFVPDSQVLTWAMTLVGARGHSRVYGPDFLHHAIGHSPAHVRHFFLGGSKECIDALIANIRKRNPDFTVAGTHHGYFSDAENERICEEIAATDPDFIWVGLGTPRQQQWIAANKGNFRRGVLLAVGFAFDVNAGMKKDAPEWVHRMGMVWLFRLLSEPRRLWKRYFIYNTVFLCLLGGQILRSAWPGNWFRRVENKTPT